MLRFTAAVVVLGLVLGAKPAEKARPAAGAGKLNAVETATMDRSVVPGEDFYAYANGNWLKTTEIPPDRSTYSSASMLDELTLHRTAELIKQAAAGKAPAGSEARKIGDYWMSFMDEAAIEAKGLAPLKPALDAVAAISDKASLSRVLGERLRADVDVLNNTTIYTDNLLGLWVAQDLDDPSRYSPFLLQGGLGMQDRDYYLNPSPKMEEIRTKYQAHLASVLKLAGDVDTDAKARRIFDLEKKIAEVHATRTETVDVEKGNNHWKRPEFDTKAPGMDWKAYFTAARLESQPVFVVWQPKAVIGMSALVASEPLETWKEYLRLRTIEHAAGFLPKAFVTESFEFYGHVLTGTPKQRDRWKRAVTATNAALGEAVGKLYVAKYFPPSEKARVEAMVKELFEAFRRRIDRLEWMAPETKAKAKAKLAALKVGVGYPNKWQDYSGLEVVAGDPLGNARRAEHFRYRENVERLGKPVDRDEWVMTPQTINAVNLPAMNALNFPAAYLQPPYFDPKRTAAVNYAAVGATIGHEVSHSFDDQGALFDAAGKLSNWWTKEDFAHFQASGEKLAEQYNGYKPFPDLAVNGKLTLSENIADVAGLAAAYDAWKLSLHGKPAPAVDGFTGDQQFFISYAQSWRQKIREPALRQRIVTDSHAPAQYRALTVRNQDPWYAAFEVKPGQALYLAPGDRVRVW